VNGGKPIVPPKVQELPVVGEPKELDGIRKDPEVSELSGWWMVSSILEAGAFFNDTIFNFNAEPVWLMDMILGTVEVDLWTIDSILDAC
jgi:hypothetical protein